MGHCTLLQRHSKSHCFVLFQILVLLRLGGESHNIALPALDNVIPHGLRDGR